MIEYPTLILEKICSHVLEDQALAYFVMDHQGKVHYWGGKLDAFNISTPEVDDQIEDMILFMDGILPLNQKSLKLPCIKMRPEICVDAFIFEIEDRYGLILLDVTLKEEWLTQSQQRKNEHILSKSSGKNN